MNDINNEREMRKGINRRWEEKLLSCIEKFQKNYNRVKIKLDTRKCKLEFIPWRKIMENGKKLIMSGI